jgi:endonuclease/exonuclease/phosphatase family metal-dependent hydrolase
MMNIINLCTYNVLAPCWADPNVYPQSSLKYLDKWKRQEVKINVLKDLVKTMDIIALQETQDGEFHVLAEVITSFGFGSFSVNHQDNYRDKYITQDPPFVPNGVGLFWNEKTIKMNEINGFDASDKGNRCIMGCFEKDVKKFRVVCVHFDTDRGKRRDREAHAVMNLLEPKDGIVDIVLGDFNFTTSHAIYKNIFGSNGFLDVIDTIGADNASHLFATSYPENSNCGVIDHITVRNGIPVSGEILTCNVLGDGKNREERINLILQRNGSDHFIVSGVIGYEIN